MVDLRLHALDEATLSGDIFVAVRIGDVQKLGRIAPERQFKFVQPNIRNYRYGKMEIFQRIGSCNISADPSQDGDQAITVPINGDNSRSFRFKVQLQNIEGHQHSKKSPREHRKHAPPTPDNAKLLEPIPEEKIIQKPVSKTKIAGARYLEKHNFELRLAQAVQELMRAEPDDPASFMGEALKRSQGVVARLPQKTSEKDPVPASSSEENKTAPGMLTPLPTPVMPSDTKRPHVHEGKHHKQKQKNKAPSILPPIESSKTKRMLPEELPPAKVSSESPKESRDEPPMQEPREEPKAETTAEPAAEPTAEMPLSTLQEELSRAPFLAPPLSMPAEAWEIIYRSFAAVTSGAEVEAVEERPSEAVVEAVIEEVPDQPAAGAGVADAIDIETAPAPSEERVEAQAPPSSSRQWMPHPCSFGVPMGMPGIMLGGMTFSSSAVFTPAPIRSPQAGVQDAVPQELQQDASPQELPEEELQQELPPAPQQAPQQREPMLTLPAYAFENIYNLFPAAPRTALADSQELPEDQPQAEQVLPVEAQVLPTDPEQANMLAMPTEVSVPQESSEKELEVASSELPKSQPIPQQVLRMPTYAWEDLYRSFVVAAPEQSPGVEPDVTFFEMSPQDLPQAQPKAQQVLPDEAQDLPEASAEQASTKEAQVFKISFAFDNLDFDKVMGSPGLADSLKNQVRNSLVDGLQVDPTCVDIDLSKGSVLVDASIYSLNPEQAERIKKQIDSAGESMLQSVSACVSQLPGLADAAVDPSLGIGAGGLRARVESSELQAAAAAEETLVQPAAGAGVADAIDIEAAPAASEDALFHAIDTDHNDSISREEFSAALEAGIITQAAVEKPAEEAAQAEMAPPAPAAEKPVETEEVASKSIAETLQAERVVARVRPSETLWSINPSIEANSQACTLDDVLAEMDDLATGTLVSTTSSHVNTDLAEQTVQRVGSSQANRLDMEATQLETSESALVESIIETPVISPSKPDADKLAMETTGETRAITPSRSEADELTFLTNAFTPSKSEADELVLETTILSPSPSEADELTVLTTALEPEKSDIEEPAWLTTVSAASSNMVSELGEATARNISQAGIDMQVSEEPVLETTESEAVQPVLETQSTEVEPPSETNAAEEDTPVVEAATPEVEPPLETPQVDASAVDTKDTPPRTEESAPVEDKAAEEAPAEEKPAEEAAPAEEPLAVAKEHPADTEEVVDKSVPALAEPLRDETPAEDAVPMEETPAEDVAPIVAAQVSFKFENLDYDKVISSSKMTESIKHSTAEAIADSIEVPLTSVDVQLSKGSVAVNANIHCSSADEAELLTKKVDAAGESLMQGVNRRVTQIPGLADAFADGAVDLGVGGLQTCVAVLRQEASSAAAEEVPIQPAAGAGVADAIDIETAAAVAEADELALTTTTKASEPVYRLVFVQTDLEEEGQATSRTISSASTHELSDFFESTVRRYSQECLTNVANDEERALQAVEKSTPALAEPPAEEKAADEVVPAEETPADETVLVETAPPPPAAEKPAETEEALAKIAPPLDEPPLMELPAQEVAPIEEKAVEEPAPVEEKPTEADQSRTVLDFNEKPSVATWCMPMRKRPQSGEAVVGEVHAEELVPVAEQEMPAQPPSLETGRPAIYSCLPSVGTWHALHDSVPGSPSDPIAVGEAPVQLAAGVSTADAIDVETVPLPSQEKPAQTKDAVAKIAPPSEEPPTMEISLEEPAPIEEKAASDKASSEKAVSEKQASEVFSEDSQKKPPQAVSVTLTVQRRPSLGTHSGVSLPSVEADALIRDALLDHPAAVLPQVSAHHLLPSVATWFLPLPLKESPSVVHEADIEEEAPATTPPQAEPAPSGEADAAPREVYVEPLEAEPARAMTPVNQLPSVGTWSMPLPRAQHLEPDSSAEVDAVVNEVAEPAPAEIEPAPAVDAEQLEVEPPPAEVESAPATGPWHSKPSVASWNMLLPRRTADEVKLEVAEPAAEVHAKQVEAESSGEVEMVVTEVCAEQLEVEPASAVIPFDQKPSVGSWSMPLQKIWVQPDEAEAALSTVPAEQLPTESVPGDHSETEPAQVSIFDAIDTDDNNMISREEFAAALKAGIIVEAPPADAAPPPPPPAAAEEHSAGSQDSSAKVLPPSDEPPVMEVEVEAPVQENAAAHTHTESSLAEAAPPPLPPPVVTEEKLAEIEEVVNKSAPIVAEPAEEAVPSKETPAEEVAPSSAAQVSFKFENLDYDKVISSSEMTESIKHSTAEAIADSIEVPLTSVDVQLSKGSVAVNANIHCSSTDEAELLMKKVDAAGESLMQGVNKRVSQIPGLADAFTDGAADLGVGGLQTCVAVLRQEEVERSPPLQPLSECPNRRPPSAPRSRRPSSASRSGTRPQRRRRPQSGKSDLSEHEAPAGEQVAEIETSQELVADKTIVEMPVTEPEPPQNAVVEETEADAYAEESTLEQAKSQKANQLVHHAISEAWKQVYRPYPEEFQDMSYEARESSRSASGAVTPLSQLPSICTWSMTACSDKSPAQSIEGEDLAPSEAGPALRTMTPFIKLPSVATWTKPLPRGDRLQPAETTIVRSQDDPVKALKLRARVSLQKASSRDLQDAIQAASS